MKTIAPSLRYPQRKKLWVTLFSAVTLLSACTMGPDYQRPDQTQLNLPAHYAGAPAQLSSAAVEREWWKIFADQDLNQLVSTALFNNTDLRQAAARVEQSNAVLDEIAGALYPEVHATANTTRSRASQVSGTLPPGSPYLRNSRNIGLSTSFELDFWGRLRRAKEGARDSALATQYGQANVEISLIKSVVNNYFLLRALDAEILVTEDTLKTREQGIKIAQGRLQAGLASGLDVEQAKGAHAAAVVQLTTLRRQRGTTANLLAQLSGQLGLEIPPSQAKDLPVLPQTPVGLPSDLLNARPDVMQAEATLAAANANIGYAKAALFPAISLTGNFGRQSQQMGDLFSNAAKVWSIGPYLDLPLFDAGIRLARVDQANAQQKQALEAYIGTLRTAFTEVRDGLVSAEALSQAEDALIAQSQAAQKALQLAEARYRSGFSAYLTLLDAQRTANDATLALIATRQARLANSVNLYAALGGGWKPADDTFLTGNIAAASSDKSESAPKNEQTFP